MNTGRNRPRTSRKIRDVRVADEHHVVTSFQTEDDEKAAMPRPCSQCPWRSDIPVGVFPAEAFRLSAGTAYDASNRTFCCHMSGIDGARTCAGFLLANADNNVAVRISLMRGHIDMDEIDSPYPLYRSYREMAEANGVSSDDPVLAPCRANDE